MRSSNDDYEIVLTGNTVVIRKLRMDYQESLIFRKDFDLNELGCTKYYKSHGTSMSTNKDRWVDPKKLELWWEDITTPFKFFHYEIAKRMALM